VRRSLLTIAALLALWPAGPMAGQALARNDLTLLQTTLGGPRTQVELERGKTALEEATATGAWGRYQAAIRHFEEAALRSPELAEPWFGLALSRLALFESGANALYSPTHPLGQSNRAAWASNLRAALAREPGHRGALTSIANLLRHQAERDQPAWLLGALIRAESLGVVTPDLVLVRGRLARRDRQYDIAAAAFREFATLGGDPSVAAIEEARAIAGTGDFALAAERYDEGLATLTELGLDFYRRDLAMITEDGELDALATRDLAAAATWIRRFWVRRDAEDIRSEGERLREHLRRWVVAHENYRVVDADRRLLFHEPWAPISPCIPRDSFNLTQAGARELPDPNDPRRAERVLDDRGLMFLRHGDPLRVVFTMGAADRDRQVNEAADEAELRRAGLPTDLLATELQLRALARSFDDRGANSAEVWSYFIDGRVRTYLFRGSSYLGIHAPTTLVADLAINPELALLRAQIDPKYMTVWSRATTPFPPKVPLSCVVSVQRLAREVRADLVVGGQTDDNPLIFPEPATPAVQTIAVIDPANGRGTIVVAYALPGHRLLPIRGEDGYTYPLQWRLTAVDSAGNIHRSEGGLVPVRADSLREGEWLTGLLTLPVPAGNWQVGVAFFQQDGRRGGAVQVKGVRLDDGAITLGDLILGREDATLRWDGIPLNPLGTWRRGSVLTLATDLRGVVGGTEGRMTYEIRQLDRASGRPAVRSSSPIVSTGPLTRIEQSIDLGRLRPGVYRLTVTIDGIAATPLRRERVFEVVE
jgi:tetratricopeptide (TPR) repeat protein